MLYQVIASPAHACCDPVSTVALRWSLSPRCMFLRVSSLRARNGLRRLIVLPPGPGSQKSAGMDCIGVCLLLHCRVHSILGGPSFCFQAMGCIRLEPYPKVGRMHSNSCFCPFRQCALPPPVRNGVDLLAARGIHALITRDA